jgi:hypothetical protein
MRKMGWVVALAALPALALAEDRQPHGKPAEQVGEQQAVQESRAGGERGGQTDQVVGAKKGKEKGREQVAPSEQQAQASRQHTQPSDQQGQAQKSVVGTVQSVEGDKLTLRNELGETRELSLDGDTRFTRGGQPISKGQLSEGAEVRAAFRGEEGNFQATEIILMGEEGPQDRQPTQPQQDQPQPEQRQQGKGQQQQ